jgi:hypothetical protein
MLAELQGRLPIRVQLKGLTQEVNLCLYEFSSPVIGFNCTEALRMFSEQSSLGGLQKFVPKHEEYGAVAGSLPNSDRARDEYDQAATTVDEN